MALVRFEGLRREFRRGQPVVDDVTLEIASGEFFCLLGPSGCGKSTLLRLIGGYLAPDAGRIWIDGREVTRLPPEARRAGMVFQNYALFPHIIALDNVAFGLRVHGVGRAARLAKANQMLDWVSLSEDERRRRPALLSGGQQQRVALARALANEPALLMLDEPFANLDRILRERLREETKSIQRRTGTTAILVTHDREEALALADRIGVMRAGRLLQTGEPQAVFERPANRFVADFLGRQNLFDVTAVEPGAVIAGGVRWPGVSAAPGEVVMVRPERVRLAPSPGALAGTVRSSRFAGTHREVSVELEGGATLKLSLLAAEEQAPEPGARVPVTLGEGALTIIPGEDQT